jgi:hypothetical protein
MEILEDNEAEPIHTASAPACCAPRNTATSPLRNTTPTASAASAKSNSPPPTISS